MYSQIKTLDIWAARQTFRDTDHKAPLASFYIMFMLSWKQLLHINLTSIDDVYNFLILIKHNKILLLFKFLLRILWFFYIILLKQLPFFLFFNVIILRIYNTLYLLIEIIIIVMRLSLPCTTKFLWFGFILFKVCCCFLSDGFFGWRFHRRQTYTYFSLFIHSTRHE